MRKYTINNKYKPNLFSFILLKLQIIVFGGFKEFIQANKDKFQIQSIYKNLSEDRLEEVFIEAFEAELVNQSLNHFKFWPLYQHEIHFHNNEMIKNKAIKIFEKIKNNI